MSTAQVKALTKVAGGGTPDLASAVNRHGGQATGRGNVGPGVASYTAAVRRHAAPEPQPT